MKSENIDMLPVIYMPAAEKYFKKLNDKKLKEKYKQSINDIRINPDIGEKKTGDLKGLYAVNIYHNKTNYELAYRLSKNEKGEIIIIIMAGTRENFYKELKRYMK